MFKYLYLIFRLFKCPHKYIFIKTVKVYKEENYKVNDIPKYVVYVTQCCKCGKLQNTKID
jgi:hypothetical protein